MRTYINSLVLQSRLYNSACSNQCGGYSSRKMSSASVILKSLVFLRCGVIRMARARNIRYRLIVFAFRVFVRYYYRKRRSGGIAFKNAADYSEVIGLRPCRGDLSVWAAKGKLIFYITEIYRNSGGNATDNSSYLRTVAFSENSYGKTRSKSVFHPLPHFKLVFIRSQKLGKSILVSLN